MSHALCKARGKPNQLDYRDTHIRGAKDFCDGRDCVNMGQQVVIEGSRRIFLCTECFPVRKAVLANQGIHMDWVVPPEEDTSP